jgi:hypothetical protein
MVCSPEQEKVGTGSREAIIYPVYSDLRIRATVSLNLFINVGDPRVGEFVRLLLEMRNLAVKMIDWYIRKKFGESENANRLLSAFVTELKGYEVTKKQLLVTAKSSTP